MSRDDGFPIADIAVGILRDVKLRRLRQNLPDDSAETTILYLAVVLSSWEEGDRLAVEEADSPAAATPQRVSALQGVGLLDGDGKVPAATWEAWFGPARDRRHRKRVNAAATNAKRWGSESHSGSLSDTQSVSPSVPSVHPSVRPRTATTQQDHERRTTCPACGDGPLSDTEPNVSTDRRGQLWHRTCPPSEPIAVAS